MHGTTDESFVKNAAEEDEREGWICRSDQHRTDRDGIFDPLEGIYIYKVPTTGIGNTDALKATTYSSRSSSG